MSRSGNRNDPRVFETPKFDAFEGTSRGDKYEADAPFKTDWVSSSGGDDRIATRGGDDRIFLGSGDDSASPGSGSDYVNGGPGDDMFFNSSGRDNARIEIENAEINLSDLIITDGNGGGSLPFPIDVFDDDFYDGRQGFDTVVYRGSFDDFDIELISDPWQTPIYRVTRFEGDDRYENGSARIQAITDGGYNGDNGDHQGGGEQPRLILEVDLLRNIEAIVFDEGTLLLGQENAPIATDDFITFLEDFEVVNTGLQSFLLENDIDFDGDAFEVVSIDEVTEAGILIEPGFIPEIPTAPPGYGYDQADFKSHSEDKAFTSLTFLNNNDIFGSLGAGDVFTDSFTYTIEDETGLQSTGTVFIDVLGSNDGPQLFIEDEYEVDEGFNGIVFTAFAGDVENDVITYSLEGDDASLFTIDPQTGEVSFITPPDVSCDIKDDFEFGTALLTVEPLQPEIVQNEDGSISISIGSPVATESSAVQEYVEDKEYDEEICFETFDITVVASDGVDEDRQDVVVTVNDSGLPDLPPAIITEIHYDNTGTDVGEFFEIRFDTDQTDTVSFAFYNGATGQEYTIDRDFGFPGGFTQVDNFVYVAVGLNTNGLQNGSPDGIALFDGFSDVNGPLLQFISYEGTFTAIGGRADGITSTDIGVSQDSSTPVGSSLQLDEETLEWYRTDGFNTAGAPNRRPGEGFDGPVRINEFHYDNGGTDVGEFIEIRAKKGFDISEVSVQLYNGANGTPYGDELLLSDGVMTSDDDFDYYVFELETNGLQNGSPDGIALLGDGDVVEFFSYEGAFVADGGPADGETSVDVGVSEPSNTPVGFSLQRNADGTWREAEENTKSEANDPDDSPAQNLLISEIQGDGATSDFEGKLVTVTAIVVGDFQNDDLDIFRDLGGFFLQEEIVDSDGNDLTSEGIFVSDVNAMMPDNVSVGDRVTVQGRVVEEFGETRIVADRVHIVTDVAIADINTMAASVDLTSITDVITDGKGDYVPDLEQFEGMLVTIENTLTINDLSGFDDFNEVGLTAGAPSSAPPAPGIDDYDEKLDAYLKDVGANEILYDDGLNEEGAGPLAEADSNFDGVIGNDNFGLGDTITNPTGVLDFKSASDDPALPTWRIRSSEDFENFFEDAVQTDEALVIAPPEPTLEVALPETIVDDPALFV
ncbi:MAG: hypothetical protein AAFP99_02540 [Pseudomonadota bacterium]